MFSVRTPGVVIPGEGPGDGCASVPLVTPANVKTSLRLPWPQHPPSYIHQLRFIKNKQKKTVDVSPLPLSPRELKLWS